MFPTEIPFLGVYCASFSDTPMYPPTPPTARGSASEKTLQSARGKKGANCKSQREASRQRRKQGARASEQGGSKRDKEDQSKPTDSKPASFKSKRQGRKHQVQEQSQFQQVSRGRDKEESSPMESPGFSHQNRRSWMLIPDGIIAFIHPQPLGSAGSVAPLFLANSLTEAATGTIPTGTGPCDTSGAKAMSTGYDQVRLRVADSSLSVPVLTEAVSSSLLVK